MTATFTFPRLLGDIGGTNARFAWQQDAGSALADIATYACADYESLLLAMQHYLQAHGKPSPRWCAIGIANPVDGDRIKMTNHDWSFSIAEVKKGLGADRFLVVNDFTALAMALPVLTPADLMQVGGGEPVPGAPMALLGAGTGLGVSGLLNGKVPLGGEGGHVTLPAVDELEESIVRALRQRYGHASAERALSGPGLVSLYEASCALAGVAAKPCTAAEVAALAEASSDAQCVQAEALFFGFLGTVAGDLALTLGARGGVYIGGGIVPKMGRRIFDSRFRERFESKGRFKGYLSSIPIYVIDAKLPPALVGAARALDQL